MATTTDIAVEKIIAHGKFGTIFLARDKNSHRQIKCTCQKLGYKEGVSYTIMGTWTRHAKHGEQFRISKSKKVLPPSNLLEALSHSDIWPSLTPKRLSSIRKYCVKNNISEEVVLGSPKLLNMALQSSLLSINVRKGWLGIETHIPLLKILVESGLAINDALSISKQLDGYSRKVTLSSPYQVLIAPSANIRIAENLHHALKLPIEINSAIQPLYYRSLRLSKSKGNTGEALADVARSIHKSSKIPIDEIMKIISKDKVTVSDESYSVVHSIFKKEEFIAKKIHSMLSQNNQQLYDIAKDYQGDEFFTSEQVDAVRNCIIKPFTVITGGPGTGKTTTIKEVIKNLESSGYAADIVTLSGKAADRATEASGRKATTIHSYLGITPTSSKSQKSFSNRAVIVDEASMVDTNLLYQLMRSIDDSCKIVLVGDINQLESIEPGAILEDISSSLPDSVTHLTRVQRFSEDSHINKFANDILSNSILYAKTNGLYTYPSSNEDHQLNTNIKIVNSYISRHGNVDDLQIISPTWKGLNGVTALNKIVQDMIPRGEENVLMLGDIKFYEKDKVIVKGDMASEGLSTGQMLRINRINYEDNSIELEASGNKYTIGISDISMLSLAYCITGHSSQGSEFKNVLFSITHQSEGFADKKMLYTIATRAKENLIITTPEGSMEKIIGNEKIKRKTFLSDLINDFSPKNKRHPDRCRLPRTMETTMLQTVGS